MQVDQELITGVAAAVVIVDFTLMRGKNIGFLYPVALWSVQKLELGVMNTRMKRYSYDLGGSPFGGQNSGCLYNIVWSYRSLT